MAISRANNDLRLFWFMNFFSGSRESWRGLVLALGTALVPLKVRFVLISFHLTGAVYFMGFRESCDLCFETSGKAHSFQK